MYRWCNIFAEFSSVNQPPSGLLRRPKIIICAVLTAIREVYHNEADAYLDELVWWLGIHHDIAISCSALHKNLQDAGLTQKLLHKIARERNQEMRAKYMDVIRDCTGGRGVELVFIDEFSKNDHDTARRYRCTPLDNTQTSLTTSCAVIGIPQWLRLASVAMMWCAQSLDHLTVISSVISS